MSNNTEKENPEGTPKNPVCQSTSERSLLPPILREPEPIIPPLANEDAFLHLIAEEPDNDGARLIFADWLEERSDPRAEFIRVQCTLAQLALGDEQYWELKAREAELLAKYEIAWTVPFRSLPRKSLPISSFPSFTFLNHRLSSSLWWQSKTVQDSTTEPHARHVVHRLWMFYRGFPEIVILPAEAFLALGEALLELRPVQCYDLYDAQFCIELLAKCPALSRLTGLKIVDISTAGLETLTQSPHISHLSSLAIETESIKEQGVKALANCEQLAHLNSLCLANTKIGPGGAQALAAARFTEIRRLNLRGCEIGNHGTMALAESPCFASLCVLNLDANKIGSIGVQALAESQHLVNLASLDLSNNVLNPTDVATIVKAPRLPNLTSLAINSTWLSDPAKELEHLATSPALARLTTLHLSNNRLGDAGVMSLASSPHLVQLTYLDLSWNACSDAGVEALAKAISLWQRLTYLDLGGNRLSSLGIRSLFSSSSVTRLRFVRLSHNPLIGDAGMEALVGSPCLNGLKVLYIAHNNIGDAGAEMLASAPHMKSLAFLDLRNNCIGDTGAQALAQSSYLASLTVIDLRENLFTTSAAELLQKRFGNRVILHSSISSPAFLHAH